MTCIGTQLQRQQAAPEKVYKSSNLSSMHAPMQLFRMRTARCHRPKPSKWIEVCLQSVCQGEEPHSAGSAGSELDCA